MAALRHEFSLFGIHLSFGRRSQVGDSVRARKFANQVYKQTNGATPELKRLYAKLKENERRASQ